MTRLAVTLVLLITCGLAAAEDIREGDYRGAYKGRSEEASGSIRIVLSKDNAGAWVSEGMFTVAGQEVKCKSSTVEVNGAKLKHACAWEAQGYVLSTVLDAEFSGGKLQGTYRTTLKADESTIDEGTWSAAMEGGKA